MADYPANPHDGLVKALLESPERAAIVLRENLPAQVTDKLAEDAPEHLPGSYVDPNLQETHSDRLFQARLHDGRTLYIYVLIEHKSEPDVGTPVQLLGYLQRIWQRYAEQSSQGRAERYRKLPPIVPLVIYNGKPEWSVPLSLLDCVDADDELRELQREFGYQLRHLRPDEQDESYSQDPVVRTVLRALAWAYFDELDKDSLVRLLSDLPPGHPLEKPLLVYIAKVYGSIGEGDVRYALEHTRPERAEELVMTVAEQWIKQGEEIGVKKGRQEGRQEGEAVTLLRLIERKFGTEAKEACQERVKKASLEKVEQWFDRAIEAERVEEVFADG